MNCYVVRVAVGAIVALTLSPSFAQTVNRNPGSLHVTVLADDALVSPRDVAGSLVKITFSNGSSQSFVWEDLGGNLGGVSNELFRLTVDAVDVIRGPWTFTNFGDDIVGLEVYTAPGQVVFDLDNRGSTPGGGGREFELFDGTDVPPETIVATYSDIVAVSGNLPVGDLYARLTIEFTQAVRSGQNVLFTNDLDATSSTVAQVQDPSTVGDFDRDGDFDCDDLDGYVGNLGAAATAELAPLDLDINGTITAADANAYVTLFVQTSNGRTGTFPGDLNCDGTVNVLGDAFALVGNLGGSASSYSQGDINFDGTVDVLGDAFILIGNLGNTNEP